MNQDQIAGKPTEVRGFAKEAVGTANYDTKPKVDGKSSRIRSRARHATGRFNEGVNTTFGRQKS